MKTQNTTEYYFKPRNFKTQALNSRRANAGTQSKAQNTASKLFAQLSELNTWLTRINHTIEIQNEIDSNTVDPDLKNLADEISLMCHAVITMLESAQSHLHLNGLSASQLSTMNNNTKALEEHLAIMPTLAQQLGIIYSKNITLVRKHNAQVEIKKKTKAGIYCYQSDNKFYAIVIKNKDEQTAAIEIPGTHNTLLQKKHNSIAEGDAEEVSSDVIKDDIIPNIYKQLNSNKAKKMSPAQRLAHTAQQEQRCTLLKRWLRRTGLLILGLSFGMVFLLLTLVMMTPAGRLGDVFNKIVPGILSVGALLYLRNPVTTSTTTPVGNMKTTIPSVPITIVQPILMVAMMRKWLFSVTINPPRESASQHTAYASTLILASEIKATLSAQTKQAGREATKGEQALLKIIDKAKAMQQEGARYLLDERRHSRLDKSRLILQACAKILEEGTIPDDEEKLLATTVTVQKNNQEKQVTLGQLIDARRNYKSDRYFSFWTKQSSSFATGFARVPSSSHDILNINDLGMAEPATGSCPS